ncbi:pyridoxal-phosphate dependent enzyme [Halioglobus maricola]|uniref:Pyridoxal-phosphate dependent enzyme n=1 Tax=Halioglobus maricola TaxID=2601894 RepID=A0A5P9NKL0_9GAMM|nr:pyridoxal-phosphate dependent enzyme [Halioglobus maricola]QFU76403.1 pyridoxal-phosphate dependent enzyme [Halioglobus maricola]
MHATPELPFYRLNQLPVLGQAMGNITVLRLDQLGGNAPGNKVFKLRYNLQKLQQSGESRVLSFGGAWSNHLHALAAVGAEHGLETIGVVRGGEVQTAMLDDARRWGMQIVKITRSDYKRRHEVEFQRELAQRFGPCAILPEGGANAEAVRGCMHIADAINARGEKFDRVLVPVGSGATLAGLAAGLAPGTVLHGVSALRGASDLGATISSILKDAAQAARVDWSILHDFHCGGFARVNRELRDFLLAFEAAQSIRLEPVYTAKMFYAAYRMLCEQHWADTEELLLVHTGGLQGRRGYPWLDGSAESGQSGGTTK